MPRVLGRLPRRRSGRDPRRRPAGVREQGRGRGEHLQHQAARAHRDPHGDVECGVGRLRRAGRTVLRADRRRIGRGDRRGRGERVGPGAVAAAHRARRRRHARPQGQLQGRSVQRQAPRRRAARSPRRSRPPRRRDPPRRSEPVHADRSRSRTSPERNDDRPLCARHRRRAADRLGGQGVPPSRDGEVASADAGIAGAPAAPQETTNAVLHASTIPLPLDLGDFASGAVDKLGNDDVLVVLFEYDPSSAGTELFKTAGIPRQLGGRRLQPHGDAARHPGPGRRAEVLQRPGPRVLPVRGHRLVRAPKRPREEGQSGAGHAHHRTARHLERQPHGHHRHRPRRSTEHRGPDHRRAHHRRAHHRRRPPRPSRVSTRRERPRRPVRDRGGAPRSRRCGQGRPPA